MEPSPQRIAIALQLRRSGWQPEPRKRAALKPDLRTKPGATRDSFDPPATTSVVKPTWSSLFKPVKKRRCTRSKELDLVCRLHIGVWRPDLVVYPSPSIIHEPWASLFKATYACIQCNASITRVGGGWRRFCGETCADRNYRQRKGSTATKRAKLAGVQYKNFNPLRIFERDAWRCKLCGVQTPKHLKGTYLPNAPELDHIIPISLGGPHLPENCQCACRRCNGLKGARIQGQGWLTGIADTLPLKTQLK